MTQVAVVTVVHGRHQHLSRQQRSLSLGAEVPHDWVVVAMDDPRLAAWRLVDGIQPLVVDLVADPEALPLAAARNLGAAEALRLGAEVLVFLDVDCLAGPTLVSGYAEVVHDEPDPIWSGPVTYLPAGLSEADLLRSWERDAPHPGRPAPAPGERLHGASPELFWSLSFAVSAATWRRVGGFHEEYVGYGGEDTDLAFAARARGVGTAWVGDARAYHQHHPVEDPPVSHVDDIVRNANLFHRRWGRWPMRGWLDAFAERGLVRLTGAGWVRTTEEDPASAADAGDALPVR